MKGCRPLTEDEVMLVQRSFGGVYADRDKALFLLGVKSGFRISELWLSRNSHENRTSFKGRPNISNGLARRGSDI